MLRINQMIATVSRVGNGNIVVNVRTADRAIRTAPAKPFYLGKRPSDLLAGKLSDAERMSASSAGGWCRHWHHQQPSPCPSSETLPTTARPAGDPPAAAWARLVISQATSA